MKAEDGTNSAGSLCYVPSDQWRRNIMKESKNAATAKTGISGISKIPMSFKALGTKRALAVFLVLVVTASAFVMMVNNGSSARLDSNSGMPDYYITYHYSGDENAPSYTFGYYGIASTEYNPEVWANTKDPELWSYNVDTWEVSNENLDNWVGPSTGDVNLSSPITEAIVYSDQMYLESKIVDGATKHYFHYFDGTQLVAVELNNPTNEGVTLFEMAVTGFDDSYGVKPLNTSYGGNIDCYSWDGTTKFQIEYSYDSVNGTIKAVYEKSTSTDVLNVNKNEGMIPLCFTYKQTFSSIGQVSINKVFGGWTTNKNYDVSSYPAGIIYPGDVVAKPSSGYIIDLYPVWINPDIFPQTKHNSVDKNTKDYPIITAGIQFSNYKNISSVSKIEGDELVSSVDSLGGFYFDGSNYAAYQESSSYNNRMFTAIYHIIGNVKTGTANLPSGTYRGVGDYMPTLTIDNYRINSSTVSGGKVICQGDVVIDSMFIDQRINSGNRQASVAEGVINANYHRLIIGTGMDVKNSTNYYVFLRAPFVIGGNDDQNSPLEENKTIVSNQNPVLDSLKVDIATYVIVHSGTYAHLSAGTAGEYTIGGQNKALSTYMVIKGAKVMGVVEGSGGKSNVNGTGKTVSSEDEDFSQGGTFVYAYGLDTAGDTYEDRATGHELPSYYASYNERGYWSIDENSLTQGGTYSGIVRGSTHLFLTGKSSVYDIQAGGRNPLSHCDNTYLEITGKAEVRHVACGTITDGSTKEADSVDYVRIVVGGNAVIATLLGAGYDTWEVSESITMKGGYIKIQIEGGEIGYVYGGGMRGSVGTAKDNGYVNIYITMTGGTIKYDLFGGGKGGLDKIHHSAGNLSGKRIGYPGRWDTSSKSIGNTNTTGFSKVVGDISINIFGGLIEGNVYGGGESVPALETYFGQPMSYYQSGSTFDTPKAYVASVTGDVTINVTGSATVLKNVYGAGKGIKTDSSGNPILDYVDVYDADGVIPDEITSIPYYSAIMIYSDGDYRFIPWLLPNNDIGSTVGGREVTTSITYHESELGERSYDNYAFLTGNMVMEMKDPTESGIHINGSIFGGGGYSKIKGNTIVELDSVNVGGEVFGGGLGQANKVSTEGQRVVWIRGDTYITGSIYGGSQYGTDGTEIADIQSKMTDPDVLNKLNRNKSIVVFEKGTAEGSIFGGGLMGKTYGNTGVYIGYTLPSIDVRAPIPNNYDGLRGVQVTVSSVFAGGNVTTGDSDMDVQDAYTEYLVQGSGLVQIYDNASNMISISGSIMGSGNACLTRGETEIDLSNFYNASELTGIHRADTVIVDNCLLKVKGRNPITQVFGQEKMVTLYKIKSLILKNGTSIAIDNPIDDIGTLYSYTSDNNPTTIAAPSNRIVYTSGSTVYIRSEDQSGKLSYNKVVGYVLMTTTQNNYGAYAIGLESDAGGFSVSSEGTMREADTSVTDGVCIWYISGVSKKVVTLELMATGSDTERVSWESFVTLSKFQTDTDMVYTGGVFTKMSNNSEGEPYTFVRPGSDSMEDNRAELGLALGYYKKVTDSGDVVTLYDPTYRQMAISGDHQSSVQGTFFKKDGKESDISGEDKNRSLISVPMQYAGNSSRTNGEFRIYMTLSGMPLDGTSYVGYLILNFQEVKMVSYGAVGEGGAVVDTPRTLVANTIEVRIDIYIYGSAEASVEENNAFSVEIKTSEKDGVREGEASTLIPQAYSMAEMTLVNVSTVGAGSGYMATQLISGGSYLIPSCEFIAPNGKAFDHWKISDGHDVIIGYPGQTLVIDANNQASIYGETGTVSASSGLLFMPIWTSEYLQIVFDPNGGTFKSGSKMDTDMTVKHDTVIRLLDCNLDAPVDKIFAYWQVIIGDNKSIAKNPNEIITITGDTVIRAVWADKAQITFKPGSHASGEDSNKYWAINERYTLPYFSDFEYTHESGYYFLTWSVQVGSSDPVDKGPGETVKIKGNTVITAKWSNGNTYTVSYVVSGGGQDGRIMHTDTVAAGTKYKLPEGTVATPPPGYSFLNWSISMGESINIEYEAGEYLTVTNNALIRINWANAVTIKFEGPSSIPDVYSAYGATYQVPAYDGESLTPFEYWYWGYKGVKYYPGQVITVTGNTETGELILTPHFLESAAPHKVVFDPTTGSGNMSVQKIANNLSFTLPNCGYSAPNEKAFLKWEVWMLNAEKNALVLQTGKENPGDTVVVTGDVYIRAVWSTNQTIYTISFNKGNGNGTMGDVKLAAGSVYLLPYSSFIAPENKVFSNWDINGADINAGDQYSVTGNVTITAEYQSASGVKTAVFNDGVSMNGTVSVFAKSNEDNTTGWSSIGNRAVWDLKTGGFTTYQGVMTNGKIGTLLGNIIGNVGFAVDGLKFTDSSGEIYFPTIDLEFERKLTNGTVQIAHTYLTFSDMQYYTIYYVDHGFTTERQYLENTRLTREVCEKPSGTNFNGWYIDSKYVNRYDYNAIVNDESDGMILYARYTYIVTLDNMNGTSFKLYVSQEDNGALLSKDDLPDPVWEGYDFKGWCKDKDRIYDWAYQSDRVTEDMTLYARWSGKEVRVYFWYDDEDGYQRLFERGEYTIMFESEGNISIPNPVTKDAGAAVSLQTFEGYTWYVVSGNNPRSLDSTYTVSTADADSSKHIILKAKSSSDTSNSISIYYLTKFGLVPKATTKEAKQSVSLPMDLTYENGVFHGWKVITGSNPRIVAEKVTGSTTPIDYEVLSADATSSMIILKALWEETAYDLSNAYQMSDVNNLYPTLKWGDSFNVVDPYHGKNILDYAKDTIQFSGQFVKWTVVSPKDPNKHIGIYADTIVGNKVMKYVTDEMLQGYDDIWDYYFNTMRGTPYERMEWNGDGKEPQVMEINLKAETTNVALKVKMDLKEEDKPLSSTVTIEDPQEFIVYPNGPDLENSSTEGGRTVYYDEYGRRYYEGEKLETGEILYYWNEDKTARYYYDGVNKCWSCVYVEDLDKYRFSPTDTKNPGFWYYSYKNNKPRYVEQGDYGLLNDYFSGQSGTSYMKTFAYTMVYNQTTKIWEEKEYVVEWKSNSDVISVYLEIIKEKKKTGDITTDISFSREKTPSAQFAASFYLKDDNGQRYKVIRAPPATEYKPSTGCTFSAFVLEPFELSNSFEFTYQLNSAVRSGYVLLGWHNDYVSIAHTMNPSADILRNVHITTDHNGYATSAELITFDSNGNSIKVPLLIGDYEVDSSDADVEGNILIVDNTTVPKPSSYSVTKVVGDSRGEPISPLKEGVSIGLEMTDGYSWRVKERVIGENEYTVSDYYADANGDILIKAVSSSSGPITSFNVYKIVNGQKQPVEVDEGYAQLGSAGSGYVWKVKNILLDEGTTTYYLSSSISASLSDANGDILFKSVQADSEPITEFNVYKIVNDNKVLVGQYTEGQIANLESPGTGNVWRIGSSDTVGYTVDSADADAMGSIVLKKTADPVSSYIVKLMSRNAQISSSTYSVGSIVPLPNYVDDGDRKFYGWESRSGFIEDDYIVSVRDVKKATNIIEITAVWSDLVPTTYTAVFVTERSTPPNDQGGRVPPDPIDPDDPEEPVIKPENIVKLEKIADIDGYHHVGWNIISGGKVKTISGSEYVVDASDANADHKLIFEAIWKKKYTVNYLASSEGSPVEIEGSPFVEGSSVPLSYHDDNNGIIVLFDENCRTTLSNYTVITVTDSGVFLSTDKSNGDSISGGPWNVWGTGTLVTKVRASDTDYTLNNIIVLIKSGSTIESNLSGFTVIKISDTVKECVTGLHPGDKVTGNWKVCNMGGVKSPYAIASTSSKTYRVTENIIQEGGSLMDESNTLTLTYRANWQVIDYTVHLTDPVNGKVDLYLENRDGKGGITYLEGSSLNDKKFYYGDKIQLSYTPDNSKVKFIRWIVTGEYYISDETDPNATIVIQGDCSISVDESTGSIVDVMISFDNGDGPNDGNLNASDLQFTRVFLKDKVEGEYYEMRYIAGMTDMEHYTAKVPYGDYDLCIWYGWSQPQPNGEPIKLESYDEPDEYILTGEVNVEIGGNTAFIYDIISAGFIENIPNNIVTFVDSEYGQIEDDPDPVKHAKYLFLFGDNQQTESGYVPARDEAKHSDLNGYSYAQRADQYTHAEKTKSNNYTRILDNDGNVVAKITKYVGASRPMLKALDARGMNINNPNGGTPPVVIAFSANQTYTTYEGFPWSYQGSGEKIAFTLESDLNLTINADSNSSITNEFYLNWVRTDSPADVIIQIAKTATPDHYVYADVKKEKDNDPSHEVPGQWFVWNKNESVTINHYDVDSNDTGASYNNIIVLVNKDCTMPSTDYNVIYVTNGGITYRNHQGGAALESGTWKAWGTNTTITTVDVSKTKENYLVVVADGYSTALTGYTVIAVKEVSGVKTFSLMTGKEEGYDTLQTDIRYKLDHVEGNYYLETYAIQTFEGYDPYPLLTNGNLGDGGEVKYVQGSGLIFKVNTTNSSHAGTDRITIYHERSDAYYVLNDNTFANSLVGYDKEVIGKMPWGESITLPSNIMSIFINQESFNAKGWYLWGETLEEEDYSIQSSDLRNVFAVLTKDAYANAGLSGITVIKITKGGCSYETGKAIGYNAKGWYLWGTGDKKDSDYGIKDSDVKGNCVVLTEDAFTGPKMTIIELGIQVAQWRVAKPVTEGYYINNSSEGFVYEVLKTDALTTDDFVYVVDKSSLPVGFNAVLKQDGEAKYWLVYESNKKVSVYAAGDAGKNHKLDIMLYTHWTCKAESIYDSDSTASVVYMDNRLMFIPLTTTETVTISFVTNYMTFSNGSQRMTFVVTKGGMFSQYDGVIDGTEIIDAFIAKYKNDHTLDYEFKGFYADDTHYYGADTPCPDFPLDSDMTFVAKWVVNDDKKKVFIYRQDGDKAEISAVQDAMIGTAVVAGKPTKLAAGTEVTISINPELGYTVDIDKTKGELGKTQVGKEIYLDVEIKGAPTSTDNEHTFRSWKLWGSGLAIPENSQQTETGDDLKGMFLVYVADFGVTHSEKYRIVYVDSLGAGGARLAYSEVLEIESGTWKLWGTTEISAASYDLGEDDVIDGYVVLVSESVTISKTNLVVFVSEDGNAPASYEIDHYYTDKYGSKYNKVEPKYVYRYDDGTWVDYKYTKLTGKDGSFIKQYVHVNDTMNGGYVFKVTRDDVYSGGGHQGVHCLVKC